MLALLYKFGGVAGNNAAGCGYALNAGYEDGPFGIQGAYEAFTDALKGQHQSVAGDVNVARLDRQRFFLARQIQFGEATMRGGYESLYAESPVGLVGFSSARSAIFGYRSACGCRANFSAADQTTDIWFIGGDYNFSRS